MAGSQLHQVGLVLFYYVHFFGVFTSPVTVPLGSVTNELIQTALRSLNENTPTHHTYTGGNLISAQKLVESPYVIYRLTFDLTPICREVGEPCPREACTIDLKQHELGAIDAEQKSIQCMYLYPQLAQDEAVQTQEHIQEPGLQEQELVDNLERQMIRNQSIELHHEIDTTRDQNDRPFIAVKASSPSYCPGCPYELNPNLPTLHAFGTVVARSMDELLPNDYKHKIVRIVKVTRAVPPSSSVVQYQLLLEVGETECLKNSLVEQSECALQQNIPTTLCLVTFEERPWQWSSRKITKNNCTVTPDIVKEQHVRPNLESESLVTNEYSKESINQTTSGTVEEDSKDTPNENSTENVTSSRSTTPKMEEHEQPSITEPPFVKIRLNESVEEEKPQGFTDKIKEFDEFLEDFDLPIKTSSTSFSPSMKPVDDEVAKSEGVRRRKRLVGAPEATSVDNEDVRRFAQLALRQFSENSEGTHEPIIVEITDASVQVVAGQLYKIKVRLGTSNCLKGTANNCRLQPESEIKECLFSVWSRPWLSTPPEITIDCNLNKRQTRSLRGVNYNRKMLEMGESMKNERMFNDFMKTYDKKYSSTMEKKRRFKIFQRNMKIIQELQRNEQGTAEYGVTMFADLTRDEFRQTYLGLRPELRMENEIPFPRAVIPDVELPIEFDWRHYNVVTPVKDQGQCGSCWAFSVTGNVEGQYAIKHKKLYSLSEQELLDCDNYDDGCNGGLPDTAYRAIEKLGGLETESDYPYEADDEKCHFKKQAVKVQVVSAVNITSNETQMAQWLVQNGPIAIGINANAMQFYMGGVSHPYKFLCDPQILDHGVLIVGYGIHKYPLFKKDLPFWIIKNSWGSRWGEQGYYRVYRGDGTCGLNSMPTSAVVA